MFILGSLVSLLTFPGVVVHEIAHLIFCRLAGVRVHKVCYFRFGNPAGYVIHDPPKNPWLHLPIAIGPFLLNSVVGILFGCYGTRFYHSQQAVGYGVCWLGISIAMHAFPSTGDARSLWTVAWSKGTPFLLKLAVIPLVIVIYLLSFGSVIWLDLIYGVVIVFYVPSLIQSFISL